MHTAVCAIRSATVGTPSILVPPAFFGISTPRTGGREVSPRRQPVPEFIEVPFQVLLELGNRLPVNPGRTFIGSNFPVCLPHQPLRNIKRLLLQVAHSFLPSSG